LNQTNNSLLVFSSKKAVAESLRRVKKYNAMTQCVGGLSRSISELFYVNYSRKYKQFYSTLTLFTPKAPFTCTISYSKI
jgi:hypothetical protein